jgi:hypothetical protein
MSDHFDSSDFHNHKHTPRKDMSDAGFIRSLQEFYKERGYLSVKQQKALLAISPAEHNRWEASVLQKADKVCNKTQPQTYAVAGDFNMQMTDTVLSENPDFKFVNIVFAPYTSTKSYTYKTLMTDLEPGDKVLVWVKNTELKAVEVVAILDPLEVDLDPTIKYAWVVQKVDTSHFDQCLAMEQKLMETLRLARVRKIKTQLHHDVIEHLTENERAVATKLVRLL